MSTVSKTRNVGLKTMLKRILIVLTVILVYRIGVSIPVPLNSIDFTSMADNNSNTLNLFNLFSGGPLTSVSLFALGVTPFITSAIVMQLLESIIPAIKETKRDGKAGAKKVNALTRGIGLFLAVTQSFVSLTMLQNRGVLPESLTFTETALFVLALVTGFLILLWLGEVITKYGIGNGVTILLVVSILSSVWSVSKGFIVTNGVKMFLLTSLALLIITVILIIVTRAERRIPIVHASKYASNTKHLSYLPFKLIHGGVAPIIFASSLLGGLASVLEFTPLKNWSVSLTQPDSYLYIIATALLVAGFVRLYERTSADPIEMANDLMKDSSFIPSVRPGWSTAKLVEDTSLRLAALSLIILIPVSLSQAFALKWFDVAFLPIAATSLLIIVTAVLDVIRQGKSISSLYSYEEIDAK